MPNVESGKSAAGIFPENEARIFIPLAYVPNYLASLF